MEIMVQKISRTQKKKVALAIQKVGERLVRLNQAQLKRLDLPAELREAVGMARTLKKHEARRRQMQYIGSLMRQIDTRPIEAALEDMAKHHDEQARQFKQVERWRDELVAGDGARFKWLTQNFPSLDRQQLMQLVRHTRANSAEPIRRRAGRKLFRYLRQLAERPDNGH